MSDDLSALFGPPASDPGRYRVRPPHRDWEPIDDLLLIPVIAACHSDRAYLEACVGLCDVLDRRPANSGLTHAQYVRECVSLIERRTVTGLLDAPTREHIDLASRLFDGRRTGLPLSWGERARILNPYAPKRLGQCRLDDVAMFLERSPSDDKTLRQYVVFGRQADVPEDLKTPGPFSTRNAPAMSAGISDLRDTFAVLDESDTAWDRRREAWSFLHGILFDAGNDG